MFVPSPDRTTARGIARPHPRRTSHRLYPAVHKAEEEKHSVSRCRPWSEVLARGRCQTPAIGDAVTAGPPCPPHCWLLRRPVCPCSPDDEHKLRVVAWSRNSREALSAPSVSCQRQYLRPMRCGGSSSQLPWTQTECLDVNTGRAAGRGQTLLISRGAALLGLFLPNLMLCFSMPLLHRCANHGSIGTCVVDDRKLGKPCGKKRKKANGDRQSARQGSRVEFVSTSLDLNRIPSLRGL